MKAKKDLKKARTQYSPEFKKQVLDRAEKDGVAATARDLKLISFEFIGVHLGVQQKPPSQNNALNGHPLNRKPHPLHPSNQLFNRLIKGSCS